MGSRYVGKVGWEVRQTRKFSASSPRLQTHLNHGNPDKLTTQSQTMSGRNTQLALVIVGRHKFFSQGWSLELKRVSPAFHLYCNSQVVSGALHILRRCQGSGTPPSTGEDTSAVDFSSKLAGADVDAGLQIPSWADKPFPTASS